MNEDVLTETAPNKYRRGKFVKSYVGGVYTNVGGWLDCRLLVVAAIKKA